MLDLNTLLAVQIASDTAIGLCFALLLLSGNRQGCGLWGLGHLVQALVVAWVLIAGIPSNHVSLSILAMLLSAASSAQIAGQARMATSQLKNVWLFIPALALFFLGTSQVLSKNDFVMVSALIMAIQRLVCSSLFLQWVRPNKAMNLYTACAITLSGLTLPLLASPQTIAPFWHMLGLLTYGILNMAGSLGVLGVQLQRTEALNRSIASHDGITGLYNRRTFLHLAQRELARSLRQHNPMSTMLIEIDSFRSLNAHYGEHGGNRVLAHLARALEKTLRKQDLIGRYSGTHFCALLPETTVKGAARLAERLRSRIEAQVVEPDGIRFTISVGIAERMPDELSTDDLLARTEAGLTLARAAGRNRVSAGGPDGPLPTQPETPILPLLHQIENETHIKISEKRPQPQASEAKRRGKAPKG